MRLKVLLLLLPPFIGWDAGFLYAQKQGQARIDSMVQAASKMKDDTTKAKLLANISLQYTPIKPDIGMQYAPPGLSLPDLNQQ